MNIEEIYTSLVNGQRKQMSNQIKELLKTELMSDFLEELENYLKDLCLSSDLILDTIMDILKSYYRNIER